MKASIIKVIKPVVKNIAIAYFKANDMFSLSLYPCFYSLTMNLRIFCKMTLLNSTMPIKATKTINNAIPLNKAGSREF